ncbi:MAG: peptidoglycan-associated lipoprotein Pal [Pseudomonadota bacterium]
MRSFISRTHIFAGLACVVFAAACAKEEEPVVVAPEPPPAPAPIVEAEPVYEEPEPTTIPGSLEDLIETVGSDRVFFEFDSSSLTADAREVLTRQATWMRRFPAVSIRIEGHADERGTREYNLALGSRRANAVKNYLVALGVSDSQVDTISYGKERPAALGSGPEAWAKNRRGVTTLLSTSNY